jgi:hypothetical protein
MPGGAHKRPAQAAIVPSSEDRLEVGKTDVDFITRLKVMRAFAEVI